MCKSSCRRRKQQGILSLQNRRLGKLRGVVNWPNIVSLSSGELATKTEGNLSYRHRRSYKNTDKKSSRCSYDDAWCRLNTNTNVDETPHLATSVNDASRVSSESASRHKSRHRAAVKPVSPTRHGRRRVILGRRNCRSSAGTSAGKQLETSCG